MGSQARESAVYVLEAVLAADYDAAYRRALTARFDDVDEERAPKIVADLKNHR